MLERSRMICAKSGEDQILWKTLLLLLLQTNANDSFFSFLSTFAGSEFEGKRGCLRVFLCHNLRKVRCSESNVCCFLPLVKHSTKSWASTQEGTQECNASLQSFVPLLLSPPLLLLLSPRLLTTDSPFILSPDFPYVFHDILWPSSAFTARPLCDGAGQASYILPCGKVQQGYRL